MQTVDLLVTGASQLCVIPGADGPQRGAALGDLGLIEDGALAVAAGEVVAIGNSAEIVRHYSAEYTLDATGCCVVPGFVDPHTHLPWAGDRADEFEMRLEGTSYMEIMAAGGGIMSTVRATREAGLEELVAANLPRLERMLAHGTTTVEMKSGYGLALESELMQLDAMRLLAERQPVEIVFTFLPAHAIPAEYRGEPDAYVDLVVEQMLPAGARWMEEHEIHLFCDVFCEEGVFDLAQTRRILERARALGYRLKIHADEFVGLGGTALAVEMGATSADHLVHTPAADIAALGRGKTVAVGLPGTPFALGHHDYTPAQAILEAGGVLALATDYNPGTSWCESMQMMLALACRYMGLTQAQALVAATHNAACAIGRGDDLGSLQPGRQADFLILDVDDYRQLGYRYGTNLVNAVVKRGEVVVAP